jgi:hypothetical protein
MRVFTRTSMGSPMVIIPIILPPKGLVKAISRRKNADRRESRGRKGRRPKDFLTTESAEFTEIKF